MDRLLERRGNIRPQIRRSSLYEASSGKDTYRSGTLVLSPTDGFAPALSPVTGVAAALPESDLLLLRSNLKTRTLPMSPYPAQPDTRIRAHFVSHVKPENDSGWTPLIGGAWGKWVRGRVLGYRDKAGRESQVCLDSAMLYSFKENWLTG